MLQEYVPHTLEPRGALATSALAKMSTFTPPSLVAASQNCRAEHTLRPVRLC